VTTEQETPATTAVETPVSAPVEDYLKAIYDLTQHSETASTNDVATRLSVSAASVTGMIRRLAAQGLLQHEPYHGVKLTDSGRTVALRTIRRHRIIECYLRDRLGYPWDKVHAEAERLEHAASDELIERMAATLGYPTEDPHGAPIPSADGEVVEPPLVKLVEMPLNASARMVRVSDRNAELLRYLETIGLVPGVHVTIVEKAPFNGPITLRIGRATHAVGSELASQVMTALVADVC
jgi:DtxR family Mn-dependent transcriptional regulator